MAKKPVVVPKEVSEGSEIVVASQTAMTPWMAELAAAAVADAAKERSGYLSAKVKSHDLYINGEAVPDNEIFVVPLVSVYENVFYEDGYDADAEASAPDCYALGVDEDQLKPAENVESPGADLCSKCPNNAWGSGSGRGKACKNKRKIAFVACPSANGAPKQPTAQDIAEGEVAIIRPPVTSTKEWGDFVRKAAALAKRPIYGVIAKLSVVKDAKTQFKIKWAPVALLSEEAVRAAYERRPTILTDLVRSYERTAVEEKSAAKRWKKPVKF